jgi:general secretion pathway protein A
MYAQFFGLSHEPFSIAPDPRYLFMSERHREALAHLLYGVNGGGGFVLLSGEIGTGKTTVCRCFLEQIPANTNVAYIFNPKQSTQELLRSVCDEFHLTYSATDPAGLPSAKDYVDALNAFLLDGHAAGRNNVLVIDEAQSLSADVLEQLRLLTNLETNERKLLQIMLIGQPELRLMLALPELEQLSQRVLARFHLDALSEDETVQYIQHRLSVAGLKGPVPFSRKGIKRIQQITRGVPRRINLLCDRAMLGAYAEGKGTIDQSIVNKASSEVFEDPRLTRGRDTLAESKRWRMLGVGLAAVLVLAVAAAVLNPSLLADFTGGTSAAKVKVPAATAQAVAQVAAVATAAAAVAASGAPSAPVTPALSASTASAASGPAAGVQAQRSELKSGFKLLPTSESQAVRELGKLWGLDLAGSDPCAAALDAQVQCARKDKVTLDTLRKLGRPVLLALVDADGQKAWALLTALDGKNATLRAGAASSAATFVVPLAALDAQWQGSSLTLWRIPSGFNERMADRGPAVDWLAARLAMAERAPAPSGAQVMDKKLLTRLIDFQRQHGLVPDGRAGPMTVMLLNRVTGVDEPRLATER